MTDAERKIALRCLGASTIKPGWAAQDLVTWSPLTTKPSVQNLKVEVLRRASSTGKDEPRCVNWSGSQLISWLALHAPDCSDEVDDKAEMESLATVVAVESLEGAPLPPHQCRDGRRIA